MESLQNRYILQKKLGSGGMATVWLAFDPVLERQVAIKIINEQFRDQADFIERFRREAAIAANLEHPHIAKVYEQGTHEGLPFIVMEYIEGPTLREHLPYLSLEEKKQVASQTLLALQYAHEQGVLHRDIKAGNIILAADGVKLIDFGVAQLTSAPHITLPGQIIGTAEYMAPEIAEGGEASVSSDLYSFAVLFYEMLAGQLPYPGKTAIEVLHRQATTDPAPPSKINAASPAYLDAIVFKGLQKNPAKRYESAAQFRESIFNGQKDDTPKSPLLPIALALALLVASFFFLQERREEMISFIGLSKKEALVVSKKLDIEPYFVIRQGPGKPGEIFWQSKKVGASIDPGDQIIFFINSRKEKNELIMPDLKGQDVARAQERLGDLGLEGQVIFIPGQAGEVLSTLPKGGSVIENKTVILRVGRTPLPDLVGENIDEAAVQLADLGIAYQIEYSESAEAPDVVLAQDPEAGLFSESVTLTVSSPSQARQVPSLIGLSETEALAAVKAEGFSAVVLYQSSLTPGFVERQKPVAGAEKTVGTVVRFWIGREE